ncbi:MAG: hypothetical protein K6G45_12985 [Lachnospiraceae bacterium]|nr:hypothetical protein [Lachnospiraceae bacterium]
MRMKKYYGRLLALILCFCLVLAGCGKSGNNDVPAGDQDDNSYTGDQGNNGNDDPGYYDGGNNGDVNGGYDDNNGNNGNDNDPNFIGGYEIVIYRVGDDTIAVELTSDDIYQNDDRYCYFEMWDDMWNNIGGMSINRNYSYVFRSISEKHGDTTTVSSQEVEGLGGNEGTNAMYGKHKMLVTMSKPGAWNEMPEFKGKYELRRDSMVLAKGNVADIMRTLTPEELEAKQSEIQMNREALNPCKADWAGEYISGYNSVPAYLKAEVSDTGIIHFHIVIRDKVYDWYAEESYYNEENYDGMKYVSASSSINEPNGSNIANLSFSSNDQNPKAAYIDMYCYDEGYGSIYFNRFNGAWHTAPSDYKDEDVKGLFKDSVFDDDCFKPVTDNYMLMVRGGSSMSGLYAGSDMYDCENIYSLYSYDANDYGIQYVEKYVLTSESDAAAAYNKTIAEMSDYQRSVYTYVQNGRNIYIIHNITDYYNYYAKMGQLDAIYGDDWYVNCHYIYPDDNSDAYYTIMYLSKPYTEDDYSMSLQQMLYWKAMAYQLPGVSDPNYYMRVEVNEMRMHFEVEVEHYDNAEGGYMNGVQDDYLRYHGDTAEGIRVYYSDWEKTGTVFVHEYIFGETEITVTEYQYPITDINNLDITLDNYKSKSFDAIYTVTFAVTEREIQGY